MGHQSSVSALAFGPDGQTLFSGSEDATVLAWDLSGIPLSDLKTPTGNGLWWLIAAVLLVIALVVLQRIRSRAAAKLRNSAPTGLVSSEQQSGGGTPRLK